MYFAIYKPEFNEIVQNCVTLAWVLSVGKSVIGLPRKGNLLAIVGCLPMDRRK